MKQISENFIRIREENPFWGDYIVLCMVVKSDNYDADIIKKAFNKFVSDEDYSKEDKVELIEYLLEL